MASADEGQTGSTTTAPPQTTTATPAPVTTTEPPVTTTTQPAATTTTRSPATTTTGAPPTTTVAPGTTSTAPAAATTSAPPATTTAASTSAAITIDQFEAEPAALFSGGKSKLSWRITGDFDKALLHVEVQGGDPFDDQDVTARGSEGELEVTAPDGAATYRLVVTPRGGGADIHSPDCAVHAFPLPSFDESASGLRRHGDGSGNASLSASTDDNLEAFWSVKDADVVRLSREGSDVGEPDRATDELCPISLSGLEPGTHHFKLTPGVTGAGGNLWAEQAALELTLNLGSAIAVTRLWGDPEPDEDGKDHPPQDLQLAAGTRVKLHFETVGAKQVVVKVSPDQGDASDLDPVDLAEDGTGTLVVDPKDQPTSYTAVAVNGEVKSDPMGPVTVHFHDADEAVSTIATVSGTPMADLAILHADGSTGESAAKLRLGAGDGLQLKWTVANAKSARLIATSLVRKECHAEADAAASGPIANEHLVASGMDLQLDEHGSGSDTVVVDPGPSGSTEYALTVTLSDDSVAAPGAKVTAYVANFNVQLRLPDGSDFARKKDCVVEIPGRDPIEATTNDDGELWLWLGNDAVESATLRLMEGETEVASWEMAIQKEQGVADGVAAISDDPAKAEGGA